MSLQGVYGQPVASEADVGWMQVKATFVFEEIAHARPARQNQLGHILDNLGLLLGRESGEPLGEALRRNLLVGFKPGGRNGVGDEDAPLCPVGRAELGSWRVSLLVFCKQAHWNSYLMGIVMVGRERERDGERGSQLEGRGGSELWRNSLGGVEGRCPAAEP